jgi:hypothetical protein
LARRESKRDWRIGVVAALLIGALLLAAFGVLDPSGRWRPWSAWLAPEEDGSWLAVTIDRYRVEGQGYRVSVSDGKIAGGRDACNDWAYAAPDPNGMAMIDTTLVGCPEDDPLREIYWRLTCEGRITLRADGRLRLSVAGHEAVFRRCEWRTVRIDRDGYHSEVRTCEPA